jgi:hypothetical protein
VITLSLSKTHRYPNHLPKKPQNTCCVGQDSCILDPALTKQCQRKSQTWISSHIHIPFPISISRSTTWPHLTQSLKRAVPRTRPAKHDIRGFLISLISPIAPISPQFERLQNPSMSTNPAPTLRSQCSAFNITLIQQTSTQPITYPFVLAASMLLHLYVGTCIHVPWGQVFLS